MVRIDAIRESNAQAKCLEGLVAVFIGGTGGIGESTAKEMFLRTTRPKAYIVGRWAHVKVWFQNDRPTDVILGAKSVATRSATSSTKSILKAKRFSYSETSAF